MTLRKGYAVGDGSSLASSINGSEAEVGSNNDSTLVRAADSDDVSIQSVKWLIDYISLRIFNID